MIFAVPHPSRSVNCHFDRVLSVSHHCFVSASGRLGYERRYFINAAMISPARTTSTSIHSQPKPMPNPVIIGLSPSSWPRFGAVAGLTARFQMRAARSRKAFSTTEIDEALMAKAANIGLISMPVKG